MHKQHSGSFVKLFEVNFMYSKHADDYLFYFSMFPFMDFGYHKLTKKLIQPTYWQWNAFSKLRLQLSLLEKEIAIHK